MSKGEKKTAKTMKLKKRERKKTNNRCEHRVKPQHKIGGRIINTEQNYLSNLNKMQREFRRRTKSSQWLKRKKK